MEASTGQGHACLFSPILLWGEWEVEGRHRRRFARRIPVCTVCGRERPARRSRPPVRLEVQPAKQGELPASEPAGLKVAAVIVARANRGDTPIVQEKGPSPPKPPFILAKGLLGSLAKRGVPASLADLWLDRFLEAGWVGLSWRVRGTVRTITEVLPLQLSALEEYAWPGRQFERHRAWEEASHAIAGLAHPVAQDVARILDKAEAQTWPPDLVRALAAVAVHADSGDVLATRVFSTKYLGGSKALEPLRQRLERLIGPLEALGIRKGATVTLMGGMGKLSLPGSHLELASFPPFVGLSSDTLEAVAHIDFPRGGLLITENLAPFEACCRGEVSGIQDVFLVWSAGYPSRGVHMLVRHAVAQGVSVTAWADLDLDGVRIARIIASWAPEKFSTHLMSPSEVETASIVQALTTRAADAIRADLLRHPGERLTDTLRAILDRDGWVEQESFLGGLIQKGCK